MGLLVSFIKLKSKYDQARFYWRMTKCSYIDLSRHSSISTDMARRWELRFVKEKQKEKNEATK